MAHATHAHPGRRPITHTRTFNPWPIVLVAGTLVLAGLIVVLRWTPNSGQVAGREHILGSSTAPVVLEEWSDFE